MTDARTLVLIEDLRGLPAETGWLEFKENFANPDAIGKRISALSNAARFADEHYAYMIYRKSPPDAD